MHSSCAPLLFLLLLASPRPAARSQRPGGAAAAAAAAPEYPAGHPGSSGAVPFAPAPCGPGRYAVPELGRADGGGGSGGVPRALHCALCPAGRYGTDYGLRSMACSGVCARGHWCPVGSRGPRERPCPAGRFGASRGLASPACSGPCREGYWCPERSVVDAHASCGAVYLFCPRGSGTPRQVSPGHYTTGGGRKNAGDPAERHDDEREQYDDEYTRTSQRLCEPGYFCGGVASASAAHAGSPEFRGHGNGANSSAREAQRSHPGGIRRACPAGTFGSIAGLETVACSGPCPAGFYCPGRTVVPTRCPAGRYGSPADADRVQNTSKTGTPWTGDGVAPLNRPENIVSFSVGLNDARCSGACALGHYCPAASTRSTQVPCPAGRYGNVTGLRTADCSLSCPGMDDTGEALSAASLDGRGGRGGGANDVGSFATGSYICPSGSESICEPGYFCPVGSTSSVMKPCGGSARYCPKGSPRPIPVTLGFFTTPIGAGRATNRSSQVECPRGSYCIGGIRTLCPAGRYGSTTGLTSPGCTGPCTAGFYCKIGAWNCREQ
jgi:hypothetical protein